MLCSFANASAAEPRLTQIVILSHSFPRHRVSSIVVDSPSNIIVFIPESYDVICMLTATTDAGIRNCSKSEQYLNAVL